VGDKNCQPPGPRQRPSALKTALLWQFNHKNSHICYLVVCYYIVCIECFAEMLVGDQVKLQTTQQAMLTPHIGLAQDCRLRLILAYREAKTEICRAGL
jgi:hypothetical protein